MAPKTRRMAPIPPSAKETRAPAMRRDIRRRYTIEKPAHTARAKGAAVSPPDSGATTPAHRQSQTEPATLPPRLASPPSPSSPWPLGNLFRTVRRILTPIGPGSRMQVTASNPLPLSPPRLLPPNAGPSQPTPSGLSPTRKRRSSEDYPDPAPPKKAKTSHASSPHTSPPLSPSLSPATMATPPPPPPPSQTPTRRSARAVREKRYQDEIEASKTPETPFVPSTETVAAKKRKRVKIDELNAIPSRRTGESAGTFALLDEFFVEDEDTVEMDENDYQNYTQRPSKMARTARNVFDLASKSAGAADQEVTTAKTSTASRARSTSPQKQSPTKTVRKTATKHPIPETTISPATPHITLTEPVSAAEKASPMDTSSSITPAPPASSKNIFTPMDARFTTPSVKHTPMDLSQTPGPPALPTAGTSPMKITQTPSNISASAIKGSPMDTSTTPFAASPMDTTASPAAVSLMDTTWSPDTQALQRKRSEAQKYKPTVGSRLKEMQTDTSAGTSLLAAPNSTNPHSSTPVESSPRASTIGHSISDDAPVTHTPTTITPENPMLASSSHTGTSYTPAGSPPKASTNPAPTSYTTMMTPPENHGFTPTTLTGSSHTPVGSPPKTSTFGNASSTTPLETPPAKPIYSTTPLATAPSRPRYSPKPVVGPSLEAEAAKSGPIQHIPKDPFFRFPEPTPISPQIEPSELHKLIPESPMPGTHPLEEVAGLIDCFHEIYGNRSLAEVMAV